MYMFVSYSSHVFFFVEYFSGTQHGLLCSYAWRLLVIKFAQIQSQTAAKNAASTQTSATTQLTGCDLWPSPSILRKLKPNQMDGPIRLTLLNHMPIIEFKQDDDYSQKKRSRSWQEEEESQRTKAIKSESTTPVIFPSNTNPISFQGVASSSSSTSDSVKSQYELGRLMYEFLQWICTGIDYKQGEIITLHSQVSHL